MIKIRLSLAAAITLGLVASSANATVYIGLQQNAGSIVTVASGSTNAVPLTFSGSFGNFEGVTASAIGQPGATLPQIMQTSSLANNNSGAQNAGTLTIYITSTGNTQPVGLVNFTSGLTSNNLAVGWTETLKTYFDPGDGIYALTDLLGTATYNSVQAQTQDIIANLDPGPYSVTAVYLYTATRRGLSSAQLAVRGQSIPEPTSLALLGSALAGLGVALRRRRTERL